MAIDLLALLRCGVHKPQLHQFLAKSFDVFKVATTTGTIDREIDCFIRTYTPGRRAAGTYNEESLDCPLAELDLIRFMVQDGVYRFNVGPKPSLPDPIFAYALLHYLEGDGPAAAHDCCR